jgi:hypothetical protein
MTSCVVSGRIFVMTTMSTSRFCPELAILAALPPAVPFRQNPNGYCPDHGTGVACPVGVARADG